MEKIYLKEIQEIKEKKRVIPATFDPVFKSLLTNKNNRDYLVEIISTITKIPKEVISKDMVISNNELSVEVYDEKKMRTDILVEIEKNIINLEMNRTYYEGLFEKNSAYHQKLMVEQYKSGEEYDIKKVIQINFDNFKEFKSKETIIKFEMRTEDGKDIEKSYGELYHVNLVKLKRIWYNKEERKSLTKFEKKLLMLCISNKKALEEITEGDESLMKVKKNLEKISDNERILGLYDVELARDYEERCRKKAHEKKEKELKEKEETIKEKEEKIKEKEQNLQNKEQNLQNKEQNLQNKEQNLQNKEENIKEREKKLEDKLKNSKLEIAKSLLKENVDINTIIKVTSLTKDEIESL